MDAGTLVVEFKKWVILQHLRLDNDPFWFGTRGRAGCLQGPSGRCFQLRDGSGSGIEKNFGFGFGYGSGSGIGTTFFSIGYYRVLKILVGYFLFTSVIRYFFGFNYGCCGLRPLDASACLIGTTNVLKLPACECLYFADLYCCWSVINFLHASRGCVPHIRPMECIKKYCPLGSISQYTPKGAGSVLDNMIFKYRVIQYHPCCQ